MKIKVDIYGRVSKDFDPNHPVISIIICTCLTCYVLSKELGRESWVSRKVTSNFTQRWIARIHEGWAQICQHQTWKKKSACMPRIGEWRRRAGHGRQSHDLVLLGSLGKANSMYGGCRVSSERLLWKVQSEYNKRKNHIKSVSVSSSRCKVVIHSTYSWYIKWQKCAPMGLNGFHIR